MAIQFVKTIGDGLTMPAGTIGARLNGVAGMSMHSWTWFTTFDALDSPNQDATWRIACSGATTGLGMNIDGGGGGVNKKHQVNARSTSADAIAQKESTTNVATGVWNSLGGAVNFSGGNVQPYLNGVAEGGGAATFGSASYVNSSPTDLDRISNSNGATVQAVNGKIAELAIWSTVLTAGEFLALSKGFSALLVRPQSLVFYAPLWGRATNEPDIVRTTTISKVNTSTNIIQVDHPKIIYPSFQEVRRFAPAGGTPPILSGTGWFMG